MALRAGNNHIWPAMQICLLHAKFGWRTPSQARRTSRSVTDSDSDVRANGALYIACTHDVQRGSFRHGFSHTFQYARQFVFVQKAASAILAYLSHLMRLAEGASLAKEWECNSHTPFPQKSIEQSTIALIVKWTKQQLNKNQFNNNELYKLRI